MSKCNKRQQTGQKQRFKGHTIASSSAEYLAYFGSLCFIISHTYHSLYLGVPFSVMNQTSLLFSELMCTWPCTATELVKATTLTATAHAILLLFLRFGTSYPAGDYIDLD